VSKSGTCMVLDIALRHNLFMLAIRHSKTSGPVFMFTSIGYMRGRVDLF
jgi:hypothetical protein